MLFPRDKGNRDGTRAHPRRAPTVTAHRIFADAIAHLLTDADGQQVDPALVVPYAYRHSYAQRHADAGIAPDVLRELMSHRSMRTTTGYYRITETRIRAAINRVARHQFDAAGRRVFHAITGLLADEQARIRIGQVAVPFGMCTEPSNVKAGGGACPYKYVCTGCGHFRSDPSYLPELKSYLQQLLADRERLRRRRRPPALGTRARRPARRADQPGPGADPPDRSRPGNPHAAKTGPASKTRSRPSAPPARPSCSACPASGPPQQRMSRRVTDQHGAGRQPAAATWPAAASRSARPSPR